VVWKEVEEVEEEEEVEEWKEGEEVWVFQSQPPLRVVTVEGVPGVDPQQTTLPDAGMRRSSGDRPDPGDEQPV